MLPYHSLTTALKPLLLDYLGQDVRALALRPPSLPPSLPLRWFLEQLAARQKAQYKLPEWYANWDLVFPPALSVEQASSEATARYKASLVSGSDLIDSTGGMGIDTYYMGQRFERVSYFEMQSEVAEAAAYNFDQLGQRHIQVANSDAIQTLANALQSADWIYADPARRNDRQEKLVLLSDCRPDIVAALPILWRSTAKVLLKTSPLLDIEASVRALGSVTEVHILGVGSECKEVLFVLDREADSSIPPTRKARVLRSDGSVLHQLDFTSEQGSTAVPLSPPQRYLYEPHAAFLKSGGFGAITQHWPVQKLAPHSHLYTSDTFVPDFPGRSFEVMEICKPDAKVVQRHLPERQANLTVRNFPATTQELRSRLRLKEGGDIYLFATTLADKQKVLIITKRATSPSLDL